MVPVSETCEPPAPHLLTHVHMTPATVHEAQCTAPMQQALVDKDMPPREHLVDAAYIAAEWLVDSREEHGIILRGPTRPSPGWQAQVEGASTIDQCTVDWDRQVVTCPQGKCSAIWAAQVDRQRDRPGLMVAFRTQDCTDCVARSRCPRAESTRAVASISRRRSRMKPSRRPGPGMPVRKGGKATRVAPALKGPSHQGGGPLACGARGIGGWPRPIDRTSRPPPPSMLTA